MKFDNDQEGFITIVALIVFILFLFIGSPFLTIMVLNHLFNLNIQFTFLNWLSVAWLHAVCASSSVRSK